jgi:hypothetical protein
LWRDHRVAKKDSLQLGQRPVLQRFLSADLSRQGQSRIPRSNGSPVLLRVAG